MHHRLLRRLWLPGALIALAAVLGWALVAVLLPRLLDPADLIYKPATPSIIITDRQGRVLYEAIDPRGNKHVPLALDEIPRACRDATLATEDANFYHHPGVDPIAIVRAAWLNWRAGETVSGGSTLTQQLARNLLLSEQERQERSLRRKLAEAWLAWRLERRYSKDELLALYLNTTYYGHFATGIEAASQAYFGVHARELDLAQCALLAGLPQSPALYNPVENPDAARERQAVVLGLMVRHGYLAAAEAKNAGREALSYASTPFPIQAPHFVMWTLSQLETLLPAERVAAGDLRVTTTLDLDWQAAAEGIVTRRLAQLRPCTAAPDAIPGVTCDARADPSRRVENAALVSLDPATGAVRALVGSPDYFNAEISGALNAAFSLRQPGSAIKPLTYAVALDPERAAAANRAPWTAATLIADLRTAFTTAEGTPYVPNNYDRTYHGPVTVRSALANSYNIPAVKTLDAIGVDALIDLAGSLGIPWQRVGASAGRPPAAMTDSDDLADSEPAGAGQWTRREPASRYGLSLTLGGGEVRLLDLTAAYGALANNGYPVTPYGIERVTSLDGEAIYAHEKAVHHDAPMVDPRTAFLITDILSDDHARQPAFGEGSVLQLDRPAAAKTGTTTDWRDNWTLGYTPSLVTGVWVGNADNTPMKDVSGISGAGPIWHDFMLAVHRDQPATAFAVPEGVVQVEVCADSGLLPGDNLPAAGRPEAGAQAAVMACPYRRLEYFIAGTEPAEVDRSHVRVPVDVRTGQPAGATTPSQYVADQTVWLLPPEYAAWAREQGLDGIATELPAAAAGGQMASARTDGLQAAADAGQPLVLVSPDPNRIYRLDPALPADAQQAPVTALLRFAPVGEIVLLVDGTIYGTLAAPEYTAWWPLTRGRHTFEAITRAADGAEVRSGEVIVFVE